VFNGDTAYITQLKQQNVCSQSELADDVLILV